MNRLVGALFVTAAVCALQAPPAFAAYKEASTVTSTTTMQTVLTTADITAIQTALVDRGINTGGVDGRWGAQTSAALRTFQESNDLTADGLPTAATLAQLGVVPSSPAVAVNDQPEGAPEAIEPAAGGGVVYAETTTRTETDTQRTTGFATVDSDSENGSTCVTCTNGPIGNGSTPSMRSNEY